MAGKTVDIQRGGLLLARGWKLFPVDARNWELCELRRQRGGAEKWMRCGRFYSSSTVEHAMLYVMDELWKASLGDEARELAVALANYRALVAEAREVAGTVAGVMEAASASASEGEGV